MHHHKWSCEYIDNLMPFEKEIYMQLLMNYLKEENKRMEEERVNQQRK